MRAGGEVDLEGQVGGRGEGEAEDHRVGWGGNTGNERKVSLIWGLGLMERAGDGDVTGKRTRAQQPREDTEQTRRLPTSNTSDWRNARIRGWSIITDRSIVQDLGILLYMYIHWPVCRAHPWSSPPSSAFHQRSYPREHGLLSSPNSPWSSPCAAFYTSSIPDLRLLAFVGRSSDPNPTRPRQVSQQSTRFRICSTYRRG